MKEFWDSRYAGKQYAYGEHPNAFFKREIQKLKPGKLLLPAEGEGRNAVYAATLGWKVTAFDISNEGKRKALELAKRFNVSIDYRIIPFDQFNPEAYLYDCIALIFAHALPVLRSKHHQLVQEWLKPNGTLILQGFEKSQFGRNSGGPANKDMLFERQELLSDFKALDNITVFEEEAELDEGKFHRGKASLINLTGIKR